MRNHNWRSSNSHRSTMGFTWTCLRCGLSLESWYPPRVRIDGRIMVVNFQGRLITVPAYNGILPNADCDVEVLRRVHNT